MPDKKMAAEKITRSTAKLFIDAGEAAFVPEGAMIDPNEYCARWARLAARFGGHGEVRCADRSRASTPPSYRRQIQ